MKTFEEVKKNLLNQYKKDIEICSEALQKNPDSGGIAKDLENYSKLVDNIDEATRVHIMSETNIIVDNIREFGISYLNRRGAGGNAFYRIECHDLGITPDDEEINEALLQFDSYKDATKDGINLPVERIFNLIASNYGFEIPSYSETVNLEKKQNASGEEFSIEDKEKLEVSKAVLGMRKDPANAITLPSEIEKRYEDMKAQMEQSNSSSHRR